MNRIFSLLTTTLFRICFTCLCVMLLTAGHAFGQPALYDASWYTDSPAFVKIGVVEDGVYRVTGNELAQTGLNLSEVNPTSIRIIENGSEIPVWIEGGGAGTLASSDAVVFVGRQNQGDDEAWAYNYDASLQSSDYFSLFSDTTWYWLTWQGAAGLRYENINPNQDIGATVLIDALRDTLHLEKDSVYYFGDSDDAGQPEYTRAEGYLWRSMSHADTSPIEEFFALSLSDIENSANLLHVSTKISSGSAPRHRVTLHLEVDGTPIDCTTCTAEADWNNYRFQTLDISIPQSLVAAGSEVQAVIISHNEFNSIPNRILVDWVEASYVRNLNMDAESLRFISGSSGARTYSISNDASSSLTVFNTTQNRRYSVAGAAVQSFADVSSTNSEYWAVRGDAYRTPVRLQFQTSTDLSSEAETVDYLIITTSALTPSANQLAAYRNTADGYNVRIVDQANIFDQFDYGRPTPIAIRRFVHATQQWNNPPDFVMFWGDVLRPEDNRARRALFPWETISFGYSPADGWFGLQQNGLDDWIERPAIGRIPIRDNETGAFFVQKITNYESAAIGDWQKRFMLLVGGQTEFEQARLRNHSNNWGQHALGTPAGMDTLQFFKTASAPLDPSFQDALSQAFEDGAAWVSYFGHSAADTWEIVTDAPEEYNNADRLPVVLSMGCNTGNFAGGRFELADRLVYGERLVLASMNGAIAHWGSSSASTIDQPANLTNLLHEVVFQDTSRVLGLALREAKKRYVETSNQNPSIYNVLLQYGLIGDPASRIRIADKPEFQLSADALSITPLAPVPADGTMNVDVRMRNWGLIPEDSVTVQMVHQLPTDETVSYLQKLLPVEIEEQLAFSIPITSASVGNNLFSLTADPENQFEEVDESNNTAEKNHTVFSAGLIQIDPIDFALLPDLRPQLRVGLATNDTSRRTIAFELDSSPSFDSSQKQSFSTQTNGLTTTWTPDAPLSDNTSYYWRARIEDDSQSAVWQTQRFTIDTNAAAGRRGWTQRNMLFEDNETDDFLQWSPTEEAWNFSEFRVSVRSTAERGGGFEKGQFIVNGTRFLGVTLGFGVIVIDGSTGELREFDSFPTYQISQELQDRFDTDSTRAVAGLTSMIENVQEGDYVFVRTRHLANLSQPPIQPEIKELFRNLGSQSIDGIDYNYLWMMMARVGFPEEAVERVEIPGTVNEIAQDTTLFFNQSRGYTLSPPIGPARTWESLQGIATISNVNSFVRVEVIDPLSDEILLNNLPLESPISLAAIEAGEHPILQLKAILADTSQQSTPQLEDWTIFFEPAIELAIDPYNTAFSADTVNISQPLDVVANIVNLSQEPAPLALLRYTLTDASNNETVLRIDSLRNISPNSPQTSTYSIDTANLSGVNRLRIDLEQPDILERYTLNNVFVREFYVQNDTEEPHVEILIDNEMLPADFEPVTNLQDPALPFVSAQPSIEITITDENSFQPIDDTSYVQIRLDRRTIPFSHPQIQFEPATTENNEARVYFTPDLSGRDTTHTLFVRVFDAAGNEADASPYQVHFRVQSAFEIESMYPYPNPMHTATTFAFRLRGDNALQADEFRLRIYTLTGMLIREFDLIEEPALLETPGLRIGWNKLPWDGRDADGDQIAPGVYLYKVFLRAEGQSIDVNNESGVEKIVVLR